MFNEVIAAFGANNIKGIRGTWIGGGDLATNYDAFQKAAAAGLSPEQAAVKTFTGEMARRAGFTKVRIIENNEASKKVVVEFTR